MTGVNAPLDEQRSDLDLEEQHAASENLTRCSLRLRTAMVVELDELVAMVNEAGEPGDEDVSRATVARAGLSAWLADVRKGPPADVAKAVRAAMVQRGRKRSALVRRSR